MNFKKILAGVLSVSLLGSSLMVSAIDQPSSVPMVEQGEVPILAPKQQLIKQMNTFRRYLNRVKRCLFTGPCTREEIAQVKRHGWKLIKLMLLLGLVGGLTYRQYRKPAAAPAEGEAGLVERKFIEAGEMIKRRSPELVKEILRGEAAIGVYPAPGRGPGGLFTSGRLTYR